MSLLDPANHATGSPVASEPKKQRMRLLIFCAARHAGAAKALLASTIVLAQVAWLPLCLHGMQVRLASSAAFGGMVHSMVQAHRLGGGVL